LLLRERKGIGDARDEEEEREDGVVMREAVPCGMAHRFGDGCRYVARKEMADVDDERCEAHDEEHVEASQGVERQQALGEFGFIHKVRVIRLNLILRFLASA
jgi:hypothetical protein